MFTKRFTYDLASIKSLYGFNPLNGPNMFISGSTALKIVNRSLGVEDNSMPSDLDIYIDIRECVNDARSLNELFYTLHINRYNRFDMSTDNRLDNYKSTWKEVQAVCIGTASSKPDMYKTISNDIVGVYSYMANKPLRNIDIILMKTSIEDLMETRFDFDVVKNYIDSKGDVWCYDTNAISKHIATITMDNFSSQFDLSYGLFKFRQRVLKYIHKGFKIRIDIDGKYLDVSNDLLYMISKIALGHLFRCGHRVMAYKSYICSSINQEEICASEILHVWNKHNVGDVVSSFIRNLDVLTSIFDEIKTKVKQVN